MLGAISYRNMFDLANKVALVTGATGILGKDFCCGLAEFGAKIIVVDLGESIVNNFVHELKNKYSIEAYGFTCDISNENDIADLVKKIKNKVGVVDILLNNAATKTSDLAAFFDSVEDYSLQTWRGVMSVNLDGAFLMSKGIGKIMLQAKSGSIINISSIYGNIAADQRIYEGSFYLDRKISNPMVYSASKAGLLGMTRHLAAEWGDKGVRVNSISPGGVESGQNDTFSQKYSLRVPMGRMAQKHEMVGAAIFLASEASSYITGQNILVDGGLSIW
jgi:NAD(P)-dependent dehydrogenase (short-subunit alcohol dehydrogenase family)